MQGLERSSVLGRRGGGLVDHSHICSPSRAACPGEMGQTCPFWAESTEKKQTGLLSEEVLGEQDINFQLDLDHTDQHWPRILRARAVV